MEPYIIVFDVGTSSLKAVLYDRSGVVIEKKSQYYSFNSEKDGWAEIDPNLWWSSLKKVIGEMMESGIALEKIEGIAVTGQMHSAVLLDEQNKPTAPVILWLDRRADKETEELQEKFNLPPYKLNSSYTLPKLYWQYKNHPEVISKTHKILWPKDYIRYLLTDVQVTDFTEGIGSSLIDWDTKQWSTGQTEVCGLKPEVLPEILPQEKMFDISTAAAEELGFSRNCRVLVGCGDIAALLGGAPHKKGRLVYSLGSSSMYFTETEKPGFEGEGLYTLDLGGSQLFGGVSSTTGASLKWIFEEIWGGEKEISFEGMMEKVFSGDIQNDTLLFFPFLAGERSPFWSDRICGSFEGLKLHHKREHLTLAVMEGVAFTIRYIIDLMDKCEVEIDEIALAGGGAMTKQWPEIIAAVTGKKVLIYNSEETVTTVLYSIMAAEFQGQNEKEVLLSLFDSPKLVEPEKEKAEKYGETYTRWVDFLNRKIGAYGISQ